MGKVHYLLAQPAIGRSRTARDNTVAELARFFPEASPVRIPVQITRATTNNAPIAPESTVIEFGTAREALFACSTKLEFADVLHLRNSDGSFDTDAAVVAVQYHPGTTFVAARFLTTVPNWIVKP